MFFGELTHYPAAGFGRFDPPSFDLELGSHWDVGAGPEGRPGVWGRLARRLLG